MSDELDTFIDVFLTHLTLWFILPGTVVLGSAFVYILIKEAFGL